MDQPLSRQELETYRALRTDSLRYKFLMLCLKRRKVTSLHPATVLRLIQAGGKFYIQMSWLIGG